MKINAHSNDEVVVESIETINAGASDNIVASAPQSAITGIWNYPAIIAQTNFIYKSLCSFSFNTAVGCSHGCRFCYVPSTATNKQLPRLNALGVTDPDEQWGQYVYVRKWDEVAFIKSLRSAERKVESLPRDGNRAIMFSTTTDPYQVIRNSDSEIQKALNRDHQYLVRRALELILEDSTLNVRILTRGPLAKRDFGVMKPFGNRLVFGMSVPTLNDKISRVYEPNAPSPLRRLQTLQAAKAAGLNVYVAVAPTYPECDEEDIRKTLLAIKQLDPITIFHEPINIRAENVARIEAHARELGVTVKSEVFATRSAWQRYAIEQLQLVEQIAEELGVSDRLHLWPDSSLGSKSALKEQASPAEFSVWLERWWNRTSEWPTADETTSCLGD